MRISDWSSDVCSSDLARGAEIFARDPERREAFVIAAGEIEISRVSASGRKYVLSVSGAHSVLALVRLLDRQPIHFTYRAYGDTTLQIGRASCRERVCQYV